MDNRRDLENLTLIYPIRDKGGNRRYRIVGTKNEIFLDSIEMLPVEHTFIFSPYTLKPTIVMNHQDRTLEANALLIGKKVEYHGEKCRVANYCRIRI
jgi:hypothetical protein